ncbi:Riboflavin biosynthesis protein RibD [Polaromonas vacuolata]|uniref:Riboflavin biosynthesis protein RibD n=2 Tax=Polaromonas vacuolata TaxID=37448 RepID=A0A6H2H8B5_9BURK|nr:bifunctional diaminohydroxyphosphoribosylaminopyrimidine deaminase/5-amino-6-(5-phosphoribosylamino)uracil reductase RibD [Polaromonas vacuolata]QJC55834.1 Riboflavin biosynthesis protein RibD [Polaromonas vacuolata]
MALALAQAAEARLICPPNPAVGAVLVDVQGQVLGFGHTQVRGGPHAEVMALRHASEQGHSTLGATLYVTLEPCSHHGRTPPCCDAVIAAGISKVVAAIADPNPLVAGQGFERLRAAGISVEVGLGAAQSRELNIGFFSRMIRRRPWLRLKVASSLDGKTALKNGQSQWITGPEARADGHVWRARSCAVLTGIGTVLEDNPRLDVRGIATPRQPRLVVVDSRLQTPPNAALFAADRPVLIYAAVRDAHKQAALQASGASVIYLPDANGKVDLEAMLTDLATREVNEIHLEAGHKLNGSFIRAALVDELLHYIAPKLIGHGQDLALLGPLTEIDQAWALEFLSADRVGPDLRVIARPSGRDQF